MWNHQVHVPCNTYTRYNLTRPAAAPMPCNALLRSGSSLLPTFASGLPSRRRCNNCRRRPAVSRTVTKRPVRVSRMTRCLAAISAGLAARRVARMIPGLRRWGAATFASATATSAAAAAPPPGHVPCSNSTVARRYLDGEQRGVCVCGTDNRVNQTAAWDHWACDYSSTVQCAPHHTQRTPCRRDETKTKLWPRVLPDVPQPRPAPRATPVARLPCRHKRAVESG